LWRSYRKGGEALGPVRPAEGVQYRVERFAAKLEERLTTLRGRVTADVTQRGRNSG